MEEEIIKAVEVLRKGGLILYPTDTVWGIGCDATNAQAVDRIYKLKGSDNKTSMILLVDKLDNAARYVKKVPDVAWQLFELTDRPLTLILPNGGGVAENLIPEQGTIAIRIPDHEFCKALLRRFGKPIVSTSANVSGEQTPARPAEISREISDGVDMVINPAFEGHPTRKPSSIIQLGEGGEIKIIRE